MGSQMLEFVDLTGLVDSECRELLHILTIHDVNGVVTLPNNGDQSNEPAGDNQQEGSLPVPMGESVEDFGFSITEAMPVMNPPPPIDHEVIEPAIPTATPEEHMPPQTVVVSEPEAPSMEPIYPPITQVPMYQGAPSIPEFTQHPHMMSTMPPTMPAGGAYYMQPPVHSQQSPHPMYPPQQHPHIYVENCHVTFGNQGHPIYQSTPVAYQQHVPQMYSYYVNEPHSLPMTMRSGPDKNDYEAQKRYDSSRSNYRGRSRGRGRRKTREEMERSHSVSSEHSFGDPKSMHHPAHYNPNFLPYQYYGYGVQSQAQSIPYIPQPHYVPNTMVPPQGNYIYQPPNPTVPQPQRDAAPVEMYVAPSLPKDQVAQDDSANSNTCPVPTPSKAVIIEPPPQPEPVVLAKEEEPVVEVAPPEPAVVESVPEPEVIPVTIPSETNMAQPHPVSEPQPKDDSSKTKPQKAPKQKRIAKPEVVSPVMTPIEKVEKPLVNGDAIEEKAPVENGFPQEDLPWGQKKVWSELFKASESPTKKVAYISPFNGVSKSPEPLESTSEQTDDAGVTVDKEKSNVGNFLKSYKPNGSSNYLLQPRGLINKNYWCYVNAPLQALLACPSLYDLMHNLNKVYDPEESGSIPFISKVSSFFANFSTMPAAARVSRKDKGKKNLEIIPEPAIEPTGIFKMLLENGDDKFTEGHQQDAEEMLSFVLNGLQDEMVECLKAIGDLGQPEENEGSLNNNNNVDDNEEEWQVQGPKKKSCVTRTAHFHSTAISEIFWGQLRSVVQHAGGATTANLQPFNTLPLDIQSPKVMSLKDALFKLVAKDEISGFTCPKTKQQVTASNQVMLESLPKVLTLQLKRFIYENGGLQKVTKRLLFPIDLEISRDLLSVNSRSKYSANQRKYKLFAVVNHEGKEANKGHYVSDIFHNGYNSWLRFDDSTVSPITEATVLKHEPPRVPYLLFYKRIDTLSPVHNNV